MNRKGSTVSPELDWYLVGCGAMPKEDRLYLCIVQGPEEKHADLKMLQYKIVEGEDDELYVWEDHEGNRYSWVRAFADPKKVCFACNPEKNTECSKTSCGICRRTTNYFFAQRLAR